jgi:hypothetical protein
MSAPFTPCRALPPAVDGPGLDLARRVATVAVAIALTVLAATVVLIGQVPSAGRAAPPPPDAALAHAPEEAAEGRGEAVALAAPARPPIPSSALIAAP